MPTKLTPDSRRITISIKQGYLTDAGLNGCVDIESYIELLKSSIDKKDAQYKALKDEMMKNADETKG